MKNGLGEPAVERIACALEQVKPDFDTASIVSQAMRRHRKVQGLEFFPLGKYQSLVLLKDCTF